MSLEKHVDSMPEACRNFAEGLEAVANFQRVLRGRVVSPEVHLSGASLRASKQCGGVQPRSV